MRLLIGFCACLLAFTLPAAAAEPAAPLLHPGTVRLALDAAGTSTLPLDSAALAYHLCNDILGDDDFGGISARGECDLSVGSPKLDLEVQGIEYQISSLGVWLQPAGPQRWKGKPLSTSCGVWDIAMDLDRKQPLSRLALEVSPVSGPAQGVFAGVVDLAVRFRFVLRDKGTLREVPAKLPLELKGHWAAVPADGSSGPKLPEGASNLVLYSAVANGNWAPAPDDATWGNTFCHLYLQAHPEVLGPLGPGSGG